MKLAGADVERINASRAAGDQHLRESAGRGAHIETDTARDGDAEAGERVVELDAAARYPGKGRLSHERRIDRDGVGSLAHRSGVRRDKPGRDRSLGLGAAFEQATLDEQDVGALARGHGGIPWDAMYRTSIRLVTSKKCGRSKNFNGLESAD